MDSVILLTCFVITWSSAEELYYSRTNRSTPSGIAAYRSALTLDWLQAEDTRQRELVSTFERDPGPSMKVSGECISYARPASGEIARLMLQLLRNLEGDDGTIIPDLVQGLVRNKLLMETSMMDSEPDLEALVETPGIMAGEPHTTFPRILTVVWLLATDPASTKVEGWCPINKVNKYMSASKPAMIAKQMRDMDPIVARVRFIMDEFIQSVTPINFQANIITKHKDSGNLKSGSARKHHNLMSRTHSRRFLYADKVRAADLNSITTTVKMPSANDQVDLFDFEDAMKGDINAVSDAKDLSHIRPALVVLECFCLIKLLF